MKTIVISAVNLTEGGPLTILRDCITCLENSTIINEYKVVVIIHKKDLVNTSNLGSSRIEYIEIPKSKRSWINRMYYEYIYFKWISKKYKPYLWLSLHDMTPSVLAERRVVYMHNSIPFFKWNFYHLKYGITYVLFAVFYKYLYRINIKKNDFLVVQQNWLRDAFSKMFNIDKTKIVVAKPNHNQDNVKSKRQYQFIERSEKEIVFFYPAFPRPFKNFEIICDAVTILNEKGIKGFKVVLTINGVESAYSKVIVEKYKHIENISFVGLLNFQEMQEQYNQTDCLIFPSKLETWGLPISEFKSHLKPMLVADLPYAKETVGEYDQVKFFDPNNCDILASQMSGIILRQNIDYDKTTSVSYPAPYADNWEELFKILLK